MQIGLKLEEIGGYARITYCFSIFLAAANASSMPHLLRNLILIVFLLHRIILSCLETEKSVEFNLSM